jgi:GDP-L-fucose synthase
MAEGVMNVNSKIYVAGHRGLVGSAIWRELVRQGYENLVGATRNEIDLMDVSSARTFFKKEQPEYVFVAAAKVGGILANNSKPASFLYENLQIQNNVIHSAYLSGVKVVVPWQFMYLPEAHAAAADGGVSPHRTIGTHK